MNVHLGAASAAPTTSTTGVGPAIEANDLVKNYGDVTLEGVHTCRHCMPYENNLNIFLARQRRRPIEEVWGDAHRFH